MFENKNDELTPLSALGEFNLIKRLTESFKLKNKSSIYGVGDDASLLKFDSSIVVSTDMLVEGVHFDLSYMSMKHLGYKSVVVNLSDIYAMNAQASQITISIAVSNRFSVEALEEFYSGIKIASEIYGVDVVGGDTTSSQSGLVISVTAIGHVEEDKVVYRNGASVNDLIVVTGDLGGAFLGLKVLEREKEVFKVNPNNQPDLDKYSYIIERQLKPEARKDIVKLLKDLGVKPTAMIDVSDGLSSELLHICNSSKVGCELFENKLPLDPTIISTCEEFNINSTTVALSGGEDYELLMTIKQEDYPKIKHNPSLTVIGYIKDEGFGRHLNTRAGDKISIVAQGWKNFDK